MRLKAMISLALLLLSVRVVSAQSPYPERPVDLRVTGVLLSADTPKREDLATVNIFVRDTPLVLRVGKVEDLTTQERERVIKDDVVLRQVRFYGPDTLMERMLKPEILGRVLIIEGWLNTSQRRFQVTAVEEVK
ncbi:MAG TPA: hypothetical protein VGX03_18920 [Candidatus Binatia bacterium]|nr:hypothetical protein [Candidatus Binatia bacterium]